MKRLRIYVDTSVIGGCFDEEFAEFSLKFMEQVRSGQIILIVSNILMDELELAPSNVKEVIREMSPEFMESVEISMETESLRDAYYRAGIVGEHLINDAHHVAVATVAQADLIVSWNFKHIVHVDKIRKYNSINLQEGYGSIEIRTPREVI
ncbi:MAG: PIN domain-containing protein [Candidatus Omnitrophota bacterium]|jgi:predicted nucleic acid-binding protein|nr:MAG: PIN domain-containing protein [Candidatus Omnitrophota bacterium]